MKFKNVTFIAIVGIIVGIGAIAYLQPHNSFQQPDWSDDSAVQETHDTSPEHYTSSTAPQKAIVKQEEDVSDISDAELQFFFTPTAPALWPLDTPQRQQEIKRHNKIKAWVIDIDRGLLGSLILGEQLNLYIPQTQRRLTITLNSIKLGRYSESRIASIDGSNGAYSAYFTLGKTSLYGSIETPEGIFHVEKRNADDAVIYAASDIRKNLDYSVSDAVPVSSHENILHN